MRSSNTAKYSHQQSPHADEPSPGIAALLLKSIKHHASDEVNELSTYFNQRNAIQKDYIDDWFEFQDNTFSKYENFKSDFNSQKHQADSNNSKFVNNVENSSLLKRDFALDIESELKDPKYETVLSSDWFREFKRFQTTQFNKLIHEIGKRVIGSRFTHVQQERRKALEEAIDKNARAVDKCKAGRGGDKINPNFKHHLVDYITSINELQKIDNIVPKILKDLHSRPKEYAKELVPVIKDFADKMTQLYKEFENNTFKDAGNRTLYANIDKDEAGRIRASRYGINLANRDLATLKLGRVVHPLVVSFFLNFLKEKTDEHNVRMGDNERIYINQNIIDIYRGENILLSELAGEGDNLLRQYKRLGFMVGVDDKHLIFVELKKTDDELTKELIIYNSDIEKHQMFHGRIYGMFKLCMGLDEPDRLGSSLNFRFQESREQFTQSLRTTKVARITKVLDLKIANCPQQVNAYDSGVYACKNATLLCLNKKIMQGIYSQNDVNQFRYEMFNIALKLGNEVDVDLLDIEV